MSRSTQKPREPITDPSHVLGFGKFKGHTVADVLELEPQYLVWIHNNTLFELGAELLETAEDSINRSETEWRQDVRHKIGG